MELSQRLGLLAARIPQMIERFTTENATRNGLLMPFIQALGYDVFDPAQVWQNYSPTGEPEAEVDCALLRGGKPVLLAVCKAATVALSPSSGGALRLAFGACDAAVGLLTNGLIYQFYNRDAQGRMSEQPVWTLDLTKLDASVEPFLKALSHGGWDPKMLADASQRWQQSQHLGRALLTLLQAPPPDLMQALVARLGGAQESDIRAVLGRLRLVSEGSLRSSPAMAAVRTEGILSDHGDERLALLIVKGIACNLIQPSRLSLGDVRGQPAVLLDDSPHKPVVSLQWAEGAHAITLFGEGKRERKIPILRVDDILQYADFIVQTLRMYDADDHESPIFRISLTNKEQ